MAKIPPEKLAAALRANLAKRKAGALEPGPQPPAESGPKGQNPAQSAPVPPLPGPSLVLGAFAARNGPLDHFVR